MGPGRVSLPRSHAQQLKPNFRLCYKITKVRVRRFLSLAKFLRSLIAIGEFWCISGKTVITYDCIFFGGGTGIICPIIETVVFLGRQNIRSHTDDGHLTGQCCNKYITGLFK